MTLCIPAQAMETVAFAGGTGTADDPWQIETVEQLVAFAARVNDGSQGGYAGQHVALTADVDLTGVDWMPIGSMADSATMFQGCFDGQGHTVSNLRFETDANVVGAGFFGLSVGEIRNVTMKNATVVCTGESAQAMAALVGYNMGVVRDCAVEGASVTGNACVGGLIGGNMGAVQDCAVSETTVTVIGDNDFSAGLVQCDIAECGGLVIGGGFGGTIADCVASGVVQAEGNEPVGLGGIGGCLEMMDSVTDCAADVTILSAQGGHAIGGLCGYAGTHSNGNIAAESEGIVTSVYPGVIENCAVRVKIDAKDATHVGGLVGTGLYYYGEETAFAIRNCTVSGEILGAVTPGAVAGRAQGCTIADCSFDVTMDGASLEAVGTTDRMYESADQ